MIDVLVVATSTVIRAGLEALVASDPALRVVGRSTGGSMLTSAITTYQPTVVLLDVDWRASDPLRDLTPQTGKGAAPAIVILTDDPRGAWCAEALRAGVFGILPREATSAEIIRAIQAAAEGLVTLHSGVLSTLLPLIALPTPVRVLPEVPHQSLTVREIEVLGMLAEGLGNKTIARQLGISEHTIKFHISSIFTKLGVSSRTEAVTMGARQGLIML